MRTFPLSTGEGVGGEAFGAYICNMKFRLILTITIVAALFAGCRKNLNDHEKPVAEFLAPDTINLTFTDTLPFTVKFTDNKGLLSYKLSLTYAVGGTLDTLYAKAKPYNLNWIGYIDGEEFTQDFNFPIPDSALGGLYRAIVTCVDEAGFQSAGDTVLFNLRNFTDTVLPEVDIALPAINQQYTAPDSINVLATVFDLSNVIYYSITVTDTLNTVKSSTDEHINVDSYSVDKMIGITNLNAGTYYVTLFVRDAYFNTRTIVIPIQIN